MTGSKTKEADKILLVKCLSGEASEHDQQRAWEWIMRKKAHLDYYSELRDAWISREVAKPLSKQRVEKAWSRTHEKITRKTVVKPISSRSISFAKSFNVSMPWTRLVAALIIAFIVGSFATVYFINSLSESYSDEAYYTIEAPRGAKSLITLSDGSKVWLNAGSMLRYPKYFNEKNRDLYLEGEAYFVVAQNKNLPFRVISSDVVVNALGTEFNVKAYPEEGVVETTLVKGSVIINRKGSLASSEGITLQPNQKASFYTGDFIPEPLVSVMDAEEEHIVKTAPAAPRPMRVRLESNINTKTATSWYTRRWVFEREKLSSMATLLERQYDVTIHFQNEEIKDFHLTGTLEEESIEQVLRALQLTLPINYKINQRELTLSINQNKIDNYRRLLRDQ